MSDIVLVGSRTQTPSVAILWITAASSSNDAYGLPVSPVNGFLNGPHWSNCD